MTVGELRVLVENLDEYIHVPNGIERLKKTILHLAVSGQLVRQTDSEGAGEDLYEQICDEKNLLASEGKIKKQKVLPGISKDEIPFNIPKSWRWARVSDLGYALGQKVPDTEFYYIDVASIDNSKQQLKQPELVKAEDAPSRARKVVKDGTVIYSTVRPYLLNTTIIRDSFDRELIASTAFAVLHPFTGVNSDWLLLNLTAKYFTDYTNEKSVGAAYPAINDAQFSMAMMPLPPTLEQKRIVERVYEIFTLIDDLEVNYKSEEAERRKLVKSSLRALSHDGSRLALKNLNGIIKTKADAAELRKAILHLAVSGRLVSQNESEGTGKELFKQIQATQPSPKNQKSNQELKEDEIPFDIPNNWTWVRLGQIIKVSSGNSLVKSQMSETGKFKVYGGNGISGLYDEFMFEQERIIIGRVGAQCGNVHITAKKSWVTDNAFIVDYPEKYIDQKFLVMLLRFLNLRKTHKGSAQPVISGSSIYPVPMQLPPLAEQKRIVQKTTELLDLVSELEKHL